MIILAIMKKHNSGEGKQLKESIMQGNLGSRKETFFV
jgi:hypothetical protein